MHRHGSLFAAKLLEWNRLINKRQMPWKGEKDPYRVWLSEVILQQTRVEQGLKYYENFITTFPDVHALAGAPEEQVFKLWEGLGYYSRCRNLIAAARYIAFERGGQFPDTYEGILQLKGVGPYTAAAIASFAYNLPFAVLDGNVFRVLSRIYDEEVPIDSTQGKKTFSALAQETMPPERAGEYNQAIMDFGAQVCKPVPLCADCFFQGHCPAFREGRQQALPVKEKKVEVRERWFNYIVLRQGRDLLVRQRTAKDIWQQLYEFLLIETTAYQTPKGVVQLLAQQFGVSGKGWQLLRTEKQRLTHLLIHFHFIVIDVDERISVPHFRWVTPSDMNGLAFPKTLKAFIAEELA